MRSCISFLYKKGRKMKQLTSSTQSCKLWHAHFNTPVKLKLKGKVPNEGGPSENIQIHNYLGLVKIFWWLKKFPSSNVYTNSLLHIAMDVKQNGTQELVRPKIWKNTHNTIQCITWMKEISSFSVIFDFKSCYSLNNIFCAISYRRIIKNGENSTW